MRNEKSIKLLQINCAIVIVSFQHMLMPSSNVRQISNDDGELFEDKIEKILERFKNQVILRNLT
jgi:hypothetical protein